MANKKIRVLGRVEDNGDKTPFIQEQEVPEKKKEKITAPFDDGYQFGDVSKTLFNGGKAVTRSVVSNFQKPGVFDDGYQIGDITKATGSTIWNLGKSGAKGFMRANESIADWGYNRLADLSDFVGADWKAKEYRALAEEDLTGGMEQDINHIIAKDYGGSKSDQEVNDYVEGMFQEIGDNSILSEKGNQTAEEIARIMTTAGYGGLLTNGTGGALSMLPLYTSSVSQAEIEARKAGADPATAHKYGILNGLIEVGTESMWGGLGHLSNTLGFSSGTLDKLTSKFTNKISNRFFRNLVEFGIDVNGEGFEELASGFLGAYAKKLTYMKDADIKQLLEDENLQDQFIEGVTTSMFMSGPSFFTRTAKNRDLKTGFNATQENLEKQIINERISEESENGKVSNKRYNEIKEQVHENIANGNVIGVDGLETAIKDGIVTPEEVEASYTNKEVRNDIRKKVIGNNYVNNAIENGNYETILNGISKDLNATNIINQYQSQISQRLSNNPEYQQLFRQNPNMYNDLVTKEAVKQYVADEIDAKTKEIDTYFKEKYDISNKDIQEIRNTLKDITAEKNIRFVFEDNIKGRKGQIADGYVTTAADGSAEIHLNANSDRALLYTVKHELYHIIKGTELEKALFDYAYKYTGSEEFEAAKKSLIESYNKNEINEEAAAKLAEELIESKDFVGYLYTDNSANSKSFIKAVGDYATKLLRNFTEEGRAKNAQLKALENFKNMWVNNYKTQLNNVGKKAKYEVSSEGKVELAKRLGGQGENWQNNNLIMKNVLPKGLQNYDKANSPSVIESHSLNNILTKKEYNNLAQATGLLLVKDDSAKNFHAVGYSDYVQAIDGMDDPIAVYQYTGADKNHNSNDFVFVTKHRAPVKNNKDGSNKLAKNGHQIEGNMVVAYHITDKSDIDNLPKVNGKPVKANVIKTVFANENALSQYASKVAKGEMVKVYEGKGKEIPYNLRTEDMNGNLKVYKEVGNTLSKVKTDSEGNPLPKGIRKILGSGRVSPAMFNDKGEFQKWWHTQFAPGSQYESFDPVMNDLNNILLQGDKISFFTSSRLVGQGYAQLESDVKKAYPKITSMEQLDKNIADMNMEIGDNLYRVEKNGKKYQLIKDSTPDEDFVANLTKEERGKLKSVWTGNASIDAALYYLMSDPKNMGLRAKIKDSLDVLKKADPDNYSNNLTAVKFLIDTLDPDEDFEVKKGVIKEYKNQEEMFRHFNRDITTSDPLLKRSFMYGVYAYPEQVFEIDLNETSQPNNKNNWEYAYKIDDSVLKSDWGKNVLQKYRDAKEKFTGVPQKTGSAANYLSTDELASYVLFVLNPQRIANGQPPYQAAKLKNINDPGKEWYNGKIADDLIVFNDSRLMKSSENAKPTNDTHIDYSINSKNSLWEQYIKSVRKDLPSRDKEVVLKNYSKEKTAPVINKKSTANDIKNNIASMTETIKNSDNLALPTSKVMSPGEIANLTKESAKSTPNLPNYKVKTGEGESKITKSIKNSNFLSQETKDKLVADAQINSYQTTTNKAEIEEAINRIDSGGAKETLNWFKKEAKFDGVDIAQGLMYLKLYEEAGDFENATKVTRKLHDITRQYGQAIQAMSMLSRMTPEGMAYHAQTELDEMFNRMVDGKSKEWIQENRSKFDLTPEEVQSIMDLTRQAANETDDYQKRVDIAKIQKIVSDKLPSSLSNKAKSYFRISMLFNPKTQVRNIVGNSLIAPVNWVSDIFATAIDKKIAQKSGYRTVSNFNAKDYIKGFKKGAYESYNDFKQDINTRNTNLNRYEQLQGKSFSDNNQIGKALNGVEKVLNLAMDGGDRIFYEGEFTNALNNLMATNGVDTPTQEMIETAENVALQRTWNDSNAYTKFVLNFRSSLNKAGGYIHLGNEQFGIGDILLPFAKTPANLTKAIVDYSPLSFLQALGKKKALLNNIENGTATMQQQRAFVDTMGKAFAGTLLYIAAYGLAASGTATGESDEDKDVKDFLQNTLGISSYSIKTPWGSFTYDWAQPIAAPLAIMTNAVGTARNGDKASGLKILEAFLGSLNSASSVLMDQSFLQSFNDVMTNNEGFVTGMLQEMSELPARGIPTLLSQINDLIDPTKRETYYKGHIMQSGLNYAKSKIPGVSKTLAPKRNTLGQEIKKYGGNNNVFNVFFNPANVNSQNMGETAKEIYRIYENTGDKNVMPSVAPYSDTASGHILTPKERSEYQKISGDIINDTVDYLLNYQDDNTGFDYESLSDSEKAVLLAKINSFAKQVARKEVLGAEISDSYKNAYEYYKQGDLGAYYLDTEGSNYALNNPDKYAVVTSTMTWKDYKKHSEAISKLRANTSNDKEETINYINSIPNSDFKGGYDDIPVNVKRAMLTKTYYPSYHDYDSQIVNAVLTHVDMGTEEGRKKAVGELKKLGFKNVKIKGGMVYYD